MWIFTISFRFFTFSMSTLTIRYRTFTFSNGIISISYCFATCCKCSNTIRWRINASSKSCLSISWFSYRYCIFKSNRVSTVYKCIVSKWFRITTTNMRSRSWYCLVWMTFNMWIAWIYSWIWFTLYMWIRSIIRRIIVCSFYMTKITTTCIVISLYMSKRSC